MVTGRAADGGLSSSLVSGCAHHGDQSPGPPTVMVEATGYLGMGLPVMDAPAFSHPPRRPRNNQRVVLWLLRSGAGASPSQARNPRKRQVSAAASRTASHKRRVLSRAVGLEIHLQAPLKPWDSANGTDAVHLTRVRGGNSARLRVQKTLPSEASRRRPTVHS